MKSIRYEHRIALWMGLLVLPSILVALWLIWHTTFAVHWRLGAATTLVVATAWLASRLRRSIVHPLLTLVNLLDALRAGDYSLRSTSAKRGDALGEVLWEVNALASRLREQRLRVEEAGALLSKVLSNVDIAIFAFDDQRQLKLINAAGERLLAQGAESALGLTASELGLEDCCADEIPSTLKTTFPGGAGSFDLRRTTFREGGRPHQLLAITDLSRALREEERGAWQRLIRVLGHELNNSLAPIRSMASTLSGLVAREPLPHDWREDVLGALQIIGDRADSLTRFMAGYTRLARLPPPTKRKVSLRALLQRAARLEQRLPVVIEDGPDVTLMLDQDQIEQALINLIKNAAEAALETRGGVRARLLERIGGVRIEIDDDGKGLAKTENLFVPFFTTKPGGSGVGLVLARQIIENHAGTLALSNRLDATGCRVTIEL